MTDSLSGSVALVTGGARRLGAAICRALAAAGARVAVHYRASRVEAEALCGELARAGTDAAAFAADLHDPTAPARLVADVVARFGRVDVVVNNASVFYRASVRTLTDAQWQENLDVNLTAPMRLVRAALPWLEQSGRGAVVNLCDIGGERPWRDHAAYCVSKAGLIMLTCALALELAPKVRVNGVSPGTALFPEDFDETQRERILRAIPMGRAATAEEIARTVQFLVAGPSFITGQIIAVDGGRSVRW
jgi:pteridine reductase